MTRTTTPRTLIVGSGFVGTGIARRLARAGDDVTLVSRGRPATPPEEYGARWSALDATDAEACTRLLARLRPERIVLVHGPSDVTWCEEHPEEADAAHAAVTANFAAYDAASRTVMISTDNVFDGHAWHNTEHTPVSPANAYGRAKRHAERRLLGGSARAVCLRVSLVYGHEPADAGKWLNFFAACAHRLADGASVEAPDDHWTTPVHVDDVAAVVAALLAAPDPLPPVLHLGGPDRVTRAEWAGVIAEALGAPAGLVVPVPKARGRYASRPENACLVSELLTGLPATRAVTVRGVRDGARDLAAAFPLRAGDVLEP
ncbi:FAD-dependent oxidoreductase [Streptomyces sp. Je 1-369]|uniref:FAD-dependent oxidoreductase n=1 Tax=Streptomyces sp. Je 1-369 TaxID=2966192 RepID=UPI002286C189|nr:FAD-dependent oxidoreductase [Streptomyces sp. Je 1-369]WAL94162.1 sugar nucleotide-binding protein [Streptomyces sp. Je 1-369]